MARNHLPSWPDHSLARSELDRLGGSLFLRERRLLWQDKEPEEKKEATSEKPEQQENALTKLQEKLRELPTSKELQQAVQDYLEGDGERRKRAVEDFAKEVQAELQKIPEEAGLPRELPPELRTGDVLLRWATDTELLKPVERKEVEQEVQRLQEQAEQIRRNIQQLGSMPRPSRRRPALGTPPVDPSVEEARQSLKMQNLEATKKYAEERRQFRRKHGYDYVWFLRKWEEGEEPQRYYVRNEGKWEIEETMFKARQKFTREVHGDKVRITNPITGDYLEYPLKPEGGEAPRLSMRRRELTLDEDLARRYPSTRRAQERQNAAERIAAREVTTWRPDHSVEERRQRSDAISKVDRFVRLLKDLSFSALSLYSIESLEERVTKSYQFLGTEDREQLLSKLNERLKDHRYELRDVGTTAPRLELMRKSGDPLPREGLAALRAYLHDPERKVERSVLRPGKTPEPMGRVSPWVETKDGFRYFAKNENAPIYRWKESRGYQRLQKDASFESLHRYYAPEGVPEPEEAKVARIAWEKRKIAKTLEKYRKEQRELPQWIDIDEAGEHGFRYYYRGIAEDAGTLYSSYEKEGKFTFYELQRVSGDFVWKKLEGKPDELPDPKTSRIDVKLAPPTAPEENSREETMEKMTEELSELAQRARSGEVVTYHHLERAKELVRALEESIREGRVAKEMIVDMVATLAGKAEDSEESRRAAEDLRKTVEGFLL